MSHQISVYFKEKTIKDPTFSKLLTKAIVAKKREIYRSYINEVRSWKRYRTCHE